VTAIPFYTLSSSAIDTYRLLLGVLQDENVNDIPAVMLNKTINEAVVDQINKLDLKPAHRYKRKLVLIY